MTVRINIHSLAIALKNLPEPKRSGDIHQFTIGDRTDDFLQFLDMGAYPLENPKTVRIYTLVAVRYSSDKNTWLEWEFIINE